MASESPAQPRVAVAAIVCRRDVASRVTSAALISVGRGEARASLRLRASQRAGEKLDKSVKKTREMGRKAKKQNLGRRCWRSLCRMEEWKLALLLFTSSLSVWGLCTLVLPCAPSLLAVLALGLFMIWWPSGKAKGPCIPGRDPPGTNPGLAFQGQGTSAGKCRWESRRKDPIGASNSWEDTEGSTESLKAGWGKPQEGEWWESSCGGAAASAGKLPWEPGDACRGGNVSAASSSELLGNLPSVASMEDPRSLADSLDITQICLDLLGKLKEMQDSSAPILPEAMRKEFLVCLRCRRCLTGSCPHCCEPAAEQDLPTLAVVLSAMDILVHEEDLQLQVVLGFELAVGGQLLYTWEKTQCLPEMAFERCEECNAPLPRSPGESESLQASFPTFGAQGTAKGQLSLARQDARAPPARQARAKCSDTGSADLPSLPSLAPTWPLPPWAQPPSPMALDRLRRAGTEPLPWVGYKGLGQGLSLQRICQSWSKLKTGVRRSVGAEQGWLCMAGSSAPSGPTEGDQMLPFDLRFKVDALFHAMVMEARTVDLSEEVRELLLDYVRPPDKDSSGHVQQTDPGPGSEDRIAARRRRIAARLDAKRREALGEDAELQVAEEEEEQRNSHKQIEESRERLAKLLFDGVQMVTNIQVAADLRETQRRAEEAELKLQRVEKLENEAKSSTDKFEEITSKWALATELTIPQELWQLLNQQQQQCALLLAEKNKLIGDLQQELKNKDEQYVQAIKKQSDDIHLLLERMEEQIRIMLKTYRHKLRQIEKAFELERRELLDNNRKKWEEAIQAHKAQELEYLRARMRKVEEFEKQLNWLRVQDEEEYNSMKIQLENDVQNLEKQLQQMKAVYQLNQEKLEYNLQVLKKQDEENTIIRSRQKRKLNRLHSLLNNLRTKLAKQEKQFREENQSLAANCERITAQCKEVQRRMRHFAVSDAEKFTEVWLMNEEEAKGLMRKALDADRIIHTQQLGLPWEEPRYWFLNNVGPLGHYKAKRMATELAAEVLAESSSEGQEEEGREKKEEVGSGEGGKEDTAKAEDRVTPLQNISKKTAKRILELVSDESGFLIESRLLRPLRALGRHERTLVKLDSIFAALDIDSEDDLYQLVDFFLKYKAQEVAVSQSQGSPGGEDVTDPAEDREDGGSGAQRDELKSPRSSLGSLPPVYIHADDVLKILKAFVQDLDKLREKERPAKEVLPLRDSSQDGEYWEALAHVIPEPTLKLWDALAVALEEYHEVLTRRASLLADAAVLQRQNSELCLLLEEYVSSGVNNKLLSPPTQWMDLSLCCPGEAQ
ncbi:dynein regulatory complex protein 1 [Phoenicopterus ruber ruber]